MVHKQAKSELIHVETTAAFLVMHKYSYEVEMQILILAVQTERGPFRPEGRAAHRVIIRVWAAPFQTAAGPGIYGVASALSSQADRIQIRYYFERKLQRCRLEILPQMLEGRCARNQQNVGRALQKPRKRNLDGCGVQRSCYL